MLNFNPLSPLSEQAVACLLGAACGDALGSIQEGTPKRLVQPISDLQGGGLLGVQAGEWGDDTAMTLCLADSLLACHGFHSRDQMDRYLRWWQQGYRSCTGQPPRVGKTVLAALTRYQHTHDPWSGDEDPLTAGNGALMRVAPIALYYYGERQSVERAMQIAAWQAMLTHGEERAVQACQLVTWLLWQLLDGEQDKEHWLDPRRLLSLLKPWGAHWHPDIVDVISGSYRHKDAQHIRATGYVIHTLEAALWALWQCDDFASGALLAANLGEEAGTTASVYGQLAGPLYGLSSLPAHWRSQLHQAAAIQQTALALIGANPCEPSGEERQRIAKQWAERLAYRGPVSTLHQFTSACHRHQLVVFFDWGQWQRDPLQLSLAEVKELSELAARKVLSALLRIEQSNEGTLLKAWESGLLRGLLLQLAAAPIPPVA
ncbi:ADP-ribosylglycohydrolase family protein [Pseudaeromonas paramecii]|uniref:ADP-ribosylglycohydrolase n=1 Tax=Pseudaeromonas paramecii TaxID=2138166 RepID=A0ABP8PU98_9GAMM